MSLFTFIKANISILEVVNDYTTLKKTGLYWKGTCPFHNEKTASFTVSPHKDIFYCFGCHLGGDVISFIAKIENCSQIDAAKQIVDRYQLTVPESVILDLKKDINKKHRYFELNKHVALWCQNNLKKSASVMHYLTKRGFNQETIKTFCLGYFPSGIKVVNELLQHMGKYSFLAHDLMEANIILEGRTAIYSPFEERIIFPIQDHLGRFCGFGGRIFGLNDRRPKYYNSRENSFFLKGSLLFGLNHAKKSIQEKESVFLVEGYTDCVAMVQHDFKNTVATLGTACTLDHLKQLARYAHRLYVLYDGDSAGQNAILRLTELCWQVSIELKIICLPQQEDPASFLLTNSSLGSLISQAQDIFVFFINSLSVEFSSKPLYEKVRLTRKLIDIIHKIQDPLKQDFLLQKAAKTLDIPFQALRSELERLEGKKHPNMPRAKKETGSDPHRHLEQHVGQDRASRLEKRIFCAIMNNIQLFTKRNEIYVLEYLPSHLQALLKKLKGLEKKDGSSIFAQFFGILNEDEKRYVSKLLIEFEQEADGESFEQLLTQLQKKHWKAIVRNIKNKLAIADHEGNRKQAEKLLQEFLKLKQKIVKEKLI